MASSCSSGLDPQSWNSAKAQKNWARFTSILKVSFESEFMHPRSPLRSLGLASCNDLRPPRPSSPCFRARGGGGGFSPTPHSQSLFSLGQTINARVVETVSCSFSSRAPVLILLVKKVVKDCARFELSSYTP